MHHLHISYIDIWLFLLASFLLASSLSSLTPPIILSCGCNCSSRALHPWRWRRSASFCCLSIKSQEHIRFRELRYNSMGSITSPTMPAGAICCSGLCLQAPILSVFAGYNVRNDSALWCSECNEHWRSLGPLLHNKLLHFLGLLAILMKESWFMSLLWAACGPSWIMPHQCFLNCPRSSPPAATTHSGKCCTLPACVAVFGIKPSRPTCAISGM